MEEEVGDGGGLVGSVLRCGGGSGDGGGLMG